MPTRLVAVVIDCADPPRLARWWAQALGWRISYEDEEETNVAPPEGEPGVELTFVPSPDPKTTQNRVHLDLSSADAADQQVIVRRLVADGASPADVGQVDVPWVVLADPEGNEFCVLEPRPEAGDTGALAAIVVQALDPAALAGWWTEVAGWGPAGGGDDWADLRAPDGRGPALGFVRVTHPHTVKNRVHLDVAPFADDDHTAEVGRILALGARRADVGQSAAEPATITWEVLADPEENEFCVLSARGPQAGEQR